MLVDVDYSLALVEMHIGLYLDWHLHDNYFDWQRYSVSSYLVAGSIFVELVVDMLRMNLDPISWMPLVVVDLYSLVVAWMDVPVLDLISVAFEVVVVAFASAVVVNAIAVVVIDEVIIDSLVH